MTDKKIFITGATGFIGEKLALKLAEKNQVFALVRPESIKKTATLQTRNIQIIPGDLLNANSYSEKLINIDYIFHLAALCKLDAPKKLVYKYNVLGTKRLLESCIDKKIKKIIHFSTAYIAGKKEKDFITENEPYPKKFKNRYEWSKAEGEKIALDFYKKYNLPVVILRPVIVYGPGSTWGFHDALSLIAKGRLWALPGKGENKIHLVHINDVVNATIYITQLENKAGEIYHISDKFPCSCAELIKIICDQLNIKYPFIILPRSIIKFSSRLPIWKWLVGDISPELLDYFLYNQSYSNEKLKSTGYQFEYPSPVGGLKSTISEYYKSGFLTKRIKNVSV